MQLYRNTLTIKGLFGFTLIALLFLCIPATIQAAQVTLAWDPSTPMPDGYRVFERTQDTVYDYGAPVWTGAGTTCTIADLADRTDYLFIVRAFAGSTESGDSNEVLYRYDPLAPVMYTLTASAGPNGTISPAGSLSASYGASQTYTIKADSGYHIADVRVDGLSVGKVTSYTFTAVNANHTISAVFGVNNYTLASSAGPNGTISPAGSLSASYGASQTYTMKADSGYNIADVRVDGLSVGKVTSYTFTAVNANHTISALFGADNQIPFADAGPDQMVEEAQLVVLSGHSYDADDGIAAMQWRQIQGPAVILSGSTSEQASFIAPDVDIKGTSLVFELIITDFSGAQASDSCIVNVSWVNIPPQATAGGDQIVSEGEQVSLSGAGSSDPDDGIAGYRWVQVQGPGVSLSDDTAVTPYFAAPVAGVEGASLLFELTVTDHGGLQDTDSCIVTVAWANDPPIADAGPDQQVGSGDTVVLDGSNSTDSDDGIVAYQWKQTAGGPVELSDAIAVHPFFTAPQVAEQDVTLEFQLTVKDKGGLQGIDRCRITVPAETSPTDTTPPELVITNPNAKLLHTKQNKIVLQGTAADNHRVDRVVWKNHRGGGGKAVGTAQWQTPQVRLYRGLNVITVTAYDAADNTGSADIQIFVGQEK